MKELHKRSKSGETLVEILVGIFIFLIILAGLQMAISYCTNAQQKSRKIRENNTEICRSLRNGSYQSGSESQTYEFKATVSRPDGEVTGSTTLFEVKVNLGTMEGEYTEDDGNKQSVLFYLFGTEP